MRVSWVLFLLIIKASVLLGQVDKILEHSEEVYSEKKNGHYICRKLFKGLSTLDTTENIFEVFFRKNFENPHMGVDFSFRVDTSILRIHNSSGWIIIYHPEKYYYHLPSKVNKRNLLENKNHLPMIDPEVFFSSIKSLSPEVFNQTSSHFIIKAGHITLIVRKEDYLIEMIEEKIQFENEIQFTRYCIDFQYFDRTEYNRDELYNDLAIPQEYKKTTLTEILSSYKTSVLKVKTMAPDWSFPTPNGDTISLSDFRGKYVILDFWYQSCFACIKSLPSLQQIHDTYKDKNVVLIGINPFDKDADRLVKFITNNEITYPIAMAYGSDIQEKYQISAYPTYYILDPEGKIIYVQEGYDSNQKRKIKTLLDKLIH